MSENESVRDFDSVINADVYSVTDEEAHYYIPHAICELAKTWPEPVAGRVASVWAYLRVFAGMSNGEIVQAILLQKGSKP